MFTAGSCKYHCTLKARTKQLGSVSILWFSLDFNVSNYTPRWEGFMQRESTNQSINQSINHSPTCGEAAPTTTVLGVCNLLGGRS